MRHSEQLTTATRDAAHAVERAERLGFPKDTRQLHGRLFGLQYALGVLDHFGDDSGLISAAIDMFGKRVNQAEKNDHPNTAKKLGGVVEGLLLGKGCIIADDYTIYAEE